MWVCVLWWLWMREFVVGRLLQVVVVGILSLVAVVGCWDGFNDLWVWWIGVALVVGCLIRWVFICYEHHCRQVGQRNREEMRDARERERKKKRKYFF